MKQWLLVLLLLSSTSAWSEEGAKTFDEGCKEAKDAEMRQQCINGNIEYAQQQMMDAFDQLKEVTPKDKYESVLVEQMEFQTSLTTDCTGVKRDECVFANIKARTQSIKDKTVRPRNTNDVDEFCKGSVGGDKFDACMAESQRIANKATALALDSLKVAVSKEERKALEFDQEKTDNAFEEYLALQCSYTQNALKKQQCQYLSRVLRAAMLLNQLDFTTRQH